LVVFFPAVAMTSSPRPHTGIGSFFSFYTIVKAFSLTPRFSPPSVWMFPFFTGHFLVLDENLFFVFS